MREEHKNSLLGTSTSKSSVGPSLSFIEPSPLCRWVLYRYVPERPIGKIPVATAPKIMNYLATLIQLMASCRFGESTITIDTL